MVSAGWKPEVVLRWTSPLLMMRGWAATVCSGWPATCCRGRLASEVWAVVVNCRPMPRSSPVSGSAGEEQSWSGGGDVGDAAGVGAAVVGAAGDVEALAAAWAPGCTWGLKSLASTMIGSLVRVGAADVGGDLLFVGGGGGQVAEASADGAVDRGPDGGAGRAVVGVGAGVGADPDVGRSVFGDQAGDQVAVLVAVVDPAVGRVGERQHLVVGVVDLDQQLRLVQAVGERVGGGVAGVEPVAGQTTSWPTVVPAAGRGETGQVDAVGLVDAGLDVDVGDLLSGRSGSASRS